MSNAGPPATITGMETVVAVALGALAAVFLGALLVLLVICRRQRCYYVSEILKTEDDGDIRQSAGNTTILLVFRIRRTPRS